MTPQIKNQSSNSGPVMGPAQCPHSAAAHCNLRQLRVKGGDKEKEGQGRGSWGGLAKHTQRSRAGGDGNYATGVPTATVRERSCATSEAVGLANLEWGSAGTRTDVSSQFVSGDVRALFDAR